MCTNRKTDQSFCWNAPGARTMPTDGVNPRGWGWQATATAEQGYWTTATIPCIGISVLDQAESHSQTHLSRAKFYLLFAIPGPSSPCNVFHPWEHRSEGVNQLLVLGVHYLKKESDVTKDCKQACVGLALRRRRSNPAYPKIDCLYTQTASFPEAFG